jgi:hypothetical protein
LLSVRPTARLRLAIFLAHSHSDVVL